MSAIDIAGPPPFTPGQHIGTSAWIAVTQEMIDQFAVLTQDPDPLHIDAEAAKAGPFGVRTAFGFLTISMLTRLLHSAQGLAPGEHREQGGAGLNYGFDRIRLISPVPAGARIRGTFTVLRTRQEDNGRIITAVDCLVEIEGSERPALSAEWLGIWLPDSDDGAR